MKENIMSRLPFIFAYYTIIVIITCASNLLVGNSSLQTRWFLELFVFLVIYSILHQALDSINFKRNWTFLLSEIGMAYVLFLVFGYAFQWFIFTPERLLFMTLIFVIIVVIGVSYMNYRHKLRTKELNDLIQRQHK